MENGFIYLIKASGLIGLFYFAYFFLLRKETFFSANRWFLLLGLITSSVLPLFFITKIIWTEPNSDSFDWSTIPVTTSVAPEPKINWYLVLACVYFSGIAISFLKLVFDFKSLIQLLKGKTMQQQDNFKLIDIAENIAPFSYFNHIVYNSALYSAVELENILEHEKVHSQQKHSIDVLISRLFCVIFWFNPFIWLYKKTIAQNLEFIADSEAAKKITDKKAYQFTLLKITTQENCVALTNHFYQSLIKKRIIMLNKNQSKKTNTWKYALVLPALVAFVFLFQIEVVAQEKETPKQEKETKSEAVDLKSFKVDEDLIPLSEGKEIYINGKKSSQEELDKLDPKDIESVDVIKKSANPKILVTTKHLTKPLKITDKDIYIDGVKSTNEEFSKLDKNTIDKMDVNTLENTIRITTKKEEKKLPNVVYIDGEKISQSELENNFVFRNVKDSKIVKGEKFDTHYITTSKKSTLKNNEVKPLIIMDGIEADSNFKIDEFPTDQIENINVLKGNSATTKYGEKGKNGVIEITTKEKTTLNNFKPIRGKAVQGFQTLKQGTVKNDWIVGYGTNGTGNTISKIINDKKINYKKAVIVIDGKQSDYKNLEKLNPKEVESVIEADIKNASEEDRNKAIQLYGKKALNGFIQVNTKTKENK
ncbi:M56 family metallopeptidase [Flavobacterium sp. FZUC8N2.13]|uniref:M56 family metallopeptidase n=1 Tax=Flavobacterium zubiriense TaxID=3138075 RepID=A0ABV4T9P7_9FLAO